MKDLLYVLLKHFLRQNLCSTWSSAELFCLLPYATRRRMRAREGKCMYICVCVFVYVLVCVKDNIECHRKNKGNPLIKAILFVIGDLFVPSLLPIPIPRTHTHPVKQYGNGHVWLWVREPRLTGLSIFAWGAGVHKSSRAHLSKNKTAQEMER